MASTFTLDSLLEETRKAFAPVTIGLSDGTEVELRALIRIGKKDREAVSDLLDVISELDMDDEDPDSIETAVETISKIFSVVADKPAKLLRELDLDDPMQKLHLMSNVLYKWIGEAQVGEAGNSPN